MGRPRPIRIFLAAGGVFALGATVKQDLQSDAFPLKNYVPAVLLAASLFVQYFATDRRSKLLKISLGLLLLALASMVVVAGKAG